MPTRRLRVRPSCGSVSMVVGAVLFAASSPVLAQDTAGLSGRGYVHREWTVATGLPINQLTGMVQSRDGYLWFSTYAGLVRFDGVRFVIFATGNSPGLPSNRLTALAEDRRGRLWIQSEPGHLIERGGGEFVDHTSEVGGGPVTTFLVESGGVWAGTSQGVYRLDFADTTFVPLHEGGIRRTVLALLVDARGTLWIGTADGLFRSSERGRGPLVRVDGVGAESVRRLAEDPEGGVWAGTRSRVFRVHGGRVEALPRDPPGMGVPTAFHFPQDGRPVWVQTWGGPWVLVDGAWVDAARGPDRLAAGVGVEGPNGELWAVGDSTVYRNGEALLVGAGRVERILFDHEGTVWVSGHGLHRFRAAAIEQRGSREGLVDNIYVVHEDRRGRLWLGSLGGGLVRVDEDGVHRYPTDPESELSDIAIAVHVDRNDDVWVGLWSGGVCRLDGDRCAQGGVDPLGGRRVRGIHEDRTGALWFGTEDGVFRRDVDGRWSYIDVDAGLPHPDVRTFAEDREGRIWMGTYGGGLARWNGAGIDTLSTTGGLSSPLIRSLYLDSDGVLWVGTEGRGLNRVVPAEAGDGVARDVTVYRTADGLFADGLHQILEDDFGRLWMSTNRGIFWVLKEELTAFAEGRVAAVHSTSYTERDGLSNREMNGGVNSAGIKDSRGNLWFGGIAGVARIDPVTVQTNEVPPPVVIEELSAGAEARPVVDGSIALTPRQRDFEVSYTALSFAAPENMRFRYRLDGFNDDWVDAGGRRTAFFTNVPPGEYTFRVVASNNAGVWNEEGAALALSVAPFFYETWPARAGFGLLLALLMLGAVRYRERHHRRQAAELEALVRARTRTIRRQAERLEALDEAKSRFFADISHEFRTPLTLTIGPLEDVRDGLHGPVPDAVAEDVGLALRSARRLLRLVEQILDVAKLEAGQMEMRATRGDLAELLARVVSGFTPLAERRRISLRLRTFAPVPELYFDSGLMEKVFANLLSNALKFTPEGGSVLVSVGAAARPAGGVRASVKDSGPGIPPDERPHVFERFHRGRRSRRHAVAGTGIGLSLAKELVALHGGAIDVESEEGFGTTFSVTLPAGTEHLPPGAIADEATDARAGDPVPALEPTLPSAADGADGAGLRTAGEATDDAPGEAAGDGDRPLVLIVDDNAEVRSFVRRHLTPRFRVAGVGDGAEALERARRDVPDLVLTDVMMPGMDGLALLRALRGDPKLGAVPVVLLSARAEVEDRVRGLETGADDYLTKPFKAAELVVRIDSVLRSRERLRDGRPAARLHASEVEVVSADDRFLEKLRSVVEEHLGDEDFDVEALAHAMAYSRSALYRRMAELDVGSPADVIRTLRLERAAQLLAGRAGSISRIAYRVGFKSVSHFSRSFRKHFGVTPSAYRDRNGPADGGD